MAKKVLLNLKVKKGLGKPFTRKILLNLNTKKELSKPFTKKVLLNLNIKKGLSKLSTRKILLRKALAQSKKTRYHKTDIIIATINFKIKKV